MASCPFLARQQRFDRAPQKLNLNILNQPKYLNTSADYDYVKEFESLDMAALKADIVSMLKTPQAWWPADYGHYGPMMVRLAWHSSGTYRVSDGRGGDCGGNIRLFPHNSWPDNGNLDKAMRLLWPIKQKYGRKISWGDLIILVGNTAMEDMGFKLFGFGAGRTDIWATEEDAYWGEDSSYEGLAHDPSKLEQPLGAIVMRLIYVNPEGPDGIPDPLLAAAHIRETFGRMSMNDEETVALVAGGHTFGKCHGAAPGANNVGPEPESSPIEAQGFGWINKFGTGKGGDTITSGLEGAWTENPIRWDSGYFDTLFKYEWELHEGPGGAKQWRPANGEGADTVPDAHDPARKHQPMMLTTDLALIKDPKYKEVSEKFHQNFDLLTEAFGKAWFKLTHRSMGARKRLLGKEVPEAQIWQDPIPAGEKLSPAVVSELKKEIKQMDLGVPKMIRMAWASACTYRHTDRRGGTDGCRLRLEPQNNWEVNCPAEVAEVAGKYEELQKKFLEEKQLTVSMADLFVLGGVVAIEQASEKAKFPAYVPFTSGRGDATVEETDAPSFACLEPKSDAFRNFKASPYQMVDRAHLLGLTAPEMVALIGGMRVLGGNHMTGDAPTMCPHGVLTKNVGALTTDFFVNLLDMNISWEKGAEDGLYTGKNRATGEEVYTATQADLAIGSNSSLRAIAQHYACADGLQAFMKDFVGAWSKVMNNGFV